jgi:hypothetical protein
LTLAVAFVLALGVRSIVRLIPAAKAAYVPMTFAAFCLLIAACLVYFTFSSSGFNRVRWARWLALAGTLVFLSIIVLRFIPSARPFGWLVGSLGIILWSIAVIIYELSIATAGIRLFTGASTSVARLLVLLSLIFLMSFPSFLVFLASNGSTAAFQLVEPKTWTHRGWLGALELAVLSMVFLFLLALPAVAHRAFSWSDTSELTKSYILSCLAIGAALSTGLFVFMFHFHRGPLARDPLGPLAAGILFAVALLVPIYRWVVKAFWVRGVVHVIDLGRWRTNWQLVLRELRAGRLRLAAALDASSDSRGDSEQSVKETSGSPGTKHLPASSEPQGEASTQQDKASPGGVTSPRMRSGRWRLKVGVGLGIVGSIAVTGTGWLLKKHFGP